MEKYIERLIEQGYTRIEACQICCDMIGNLSLFDLDNYVRWVEKCGSCITQIRQVEA